MDVELAEVDTDTPVAGRPVPHARVRRLYVVASSVIALHVAAVTWLSAGGGLYIDDIRAQAYAAGRPFYPFVIESNRTHLAPGARTIDWFMARYAPLEHWPAVVITALTALLLAFEERCQGLSELLVGILPGMKADGVRKLPVHGLLLRRLTRKVSGAPPRRSRNRSHQSARPLD